MKQTLEEAAYDYATNKTKFRKEVLKEVDPDNYVSRKSDCMEDFQCGAEWHAKQSIEVLSSILENWVHGGDADCIIAEFEEKLRENRKTEQLKRITMSILSDEWCCMNCVHQEECLLDDPELNLLGYCMQYEDEEWEE